MSSFTKQPVRLRLDTSNDAKNYAMELVERLHQWPSAQGVST